MNAPPAPVTPREALILAAAVIGAVLVGLSPVGDLVETAVYAFRDVVAGWIGA